MVLEGSLVGDRIVERGVFCTAGIVSDVIKNVPTPIKRANEAQREEEEGTWTNRDRQE